MMHKTVFKVKRYIEEEHLITKGDSIVLGVSGGADSVCLLSILNSLKDIFDLKLSVVHVNHLIREDASEDANYVKKFCKELNIPFYLFEEDIEKMAKLLHISTEDAGRQFRYKVFNQISNGTAKIAVAHNSNDKVETFFLNLFRGAGINGLCSIQNRRDNIIRPILCLDRSEIESYLMDCNLDFKIDSTNSTTLYTRNKIRNEVIPYVKENINTQVVSNILNTINIMEDVNEFFEDYVQNFYLDNVVEKEDYLWLDLEIFNKEKNIVKTLVLFKALEYFIPSKKDISSKNIEEILNICTKNGKKEIVLLKNLRVIKNYGMLVIYNEKFEPKLNLLEKNKTLYKTENFLYNLEILNASEVDINFIIKQNNNNVKFFDLDKLDLNLLELDYIKEENRIIINDKDISLREYYNSNKVKWNNEVFSYGNYVLWVVGYRIGDLYKISNETKHILRIERLE